MKSFQAIQCNMHQYNCIALSSHTFSLHNKTALLFSLQQRLPRDVEILGEFSAHMYFSPVSPITHDGQPFDGIHYVQLNVKRSGK